MPSSVITLVKLSFETSSPTKSNDKKDLIPIPVPPQDAVSELS
jgi:hypothetical protein